MRKSQEVNLLTLVEDKHKYDGRQMVEQIDKPLVAGDQKSSTCSCMRISPSLSIMQR